MSTRIVINGREVTDPLTRRLITAGVLLVTATFVLVALLLLIPLIGLALGIAFSSVLFLTGAAVTRKFLKPSRTHRLDESDNDINRLS